MRVGRFGVRVGVVLTLVLAAALAAACVHDPPRPVVDAASVRYAGRDGGFYRYESSVVLKNAGGAGQVDLVVIGTAEGRDVTYYRAGLWLGAGEVRVWTARFSTAEPQRFVVVQARVGERIESSRLVAVDP